jgi:hypothetical protein
MESLENDVKVSVWMNIQIKVLDISIIIPIDLNEICAFSFYIFYKI